uniref:Uncharacterized protein n=1 Tax=Bionectria ochroleuca TaxID=29856 RepID=A0A8H7N8Y2_BIOOC
MSNVMSNVLGALGSVIGYLGAEAATESFFERLLWPERFYNDANLFVLLTLSFFLPMAGPLHGAALKTLDTFRKNGLYLGKRRGNMLGTTFFSDTETKYFRLTGLNQTEEAKESRNGFWVRVLREVKCQNRPARLHKRDSAEPVIGIIPPYRATQLVHHLKLCYAKDAIAADADVIHVTEASIGWRTVLGTVLSEFSSIAIAITAAVGKPFESYWLAGYLLVPVVMKLVALFISVRRESILDWIRPEHKDQLYEIDDPRHGYAIIQGPPDVVLQFFRHYGHPKRDRGAAGRRDRAREVLSMGLIYLFVLYFPVGLIISLWIAKNAQLLWLSFQVYTILTMHAIRIVGWDNQGRTEARVARHLEQKRSVWLRRPDGLGIVACLETTDVPNVDSAKREIDAIVRDYYQDRRTP